MLSPCKARLRYSCCAASVLALVALSTAPPRHAATEIHCLCRRQCPEVAHCARASVCHLFRFDSTHLRHLSLPLCLPLAKHAALTLVAVTPAGHTDAVLALIHLEAPSKDRADDARVFSASLDNTICCWDPYDMTCIYKYDPLSPPPRLSLLLNATRHLMCSLLPPSPDSGRRPLRSAACCTFPTVDC